MGKIRVATLGDETQEKEQQQKSKVRREAKKLGKSRLPTQHNDGGQEKTHVKGVGLKGGQQIKVMEGIELKPEFEHSQETTPIEKPKKAKKTKIRSRSKRYQKLSQIVDKTKTYPFKDAINLLIKTSNTHFNGTVEAHINLNPATLPKDKLSLSGKVNLPHGTGKKRTIAIADEALIAKVAAGKIEFDVLVAHPTLMPKLAKVAKILGPKGLMPNPKAGTVTTDPEKRVKELSGGELSWKTEPDHPVIHQIVGKVDFGEEKLKENIAKLIKSIGAGKIAKLTLNATMGPGIKVDITTM